MVQTTFTLCASVFILCCLNHYFALTKVKYIQRAEKYSPGDVLTHKFSYQSRISLAGQSITETLKEHRLRRQRIFIMSTWLEDLLPDPHQGRSWMFNMAADSAKITVRAMIVILSATTIVGKPRLVTRM